MNDPHRVAIVTGASRGIGAGLVAGYRKLGFRVVATSRSIAPSNAFVTGEVCHVDGGEAAGVG
jgi:NAD(P)-dependent dehydrogenase (short-subunit alcohol dehydrogenase family)